MPGLSWAGHFWSAFLIFISFLTVSLKETCKVVWQVRKWHWNKKQSSLSFIILFHWVLISMVLKKKPPYKMTDGEAKRGYGGVWPAKDSQPYRDGEPTPRDHGLEELHCSHCGPWPSSMSIIRELTRNAKSQALPETYWIRICLLTGWPGDLSTL